MENSNLVLGLIQGYEIETGTKTISADSMKEFPVYNIKSSWVFYLKLGHEIIEASLILICSFHRGSEISRQNREKVIL